MIITIWLRDDTALSVRIAKSLREGTLKCFNERRIIVETRLGFDMTKLLDLYRTESNFLLLEISKS